MTPIVPPPPSGRIDLARTIAQGAPLFLLAGIMSLTTMLPAAASVRTVTLAAERQIFVEAVVNSTTREWTAEFARHSRRYVAPRLLFLHPPRGHPASGSGYSRGVALAFDLGQFIDLKTILLVDGDLVAALIVAHEVAHHVQYLVERSHPIRSQSAGDRELDADCAAGWWLQQANRRDRQTSGRPWFVTTALDLQLTRALTILTLPGRRASPSFGSIEESTHGSINDRVARIQQGLAAKAITQCGPTFAF